MLLERQLIEFYARMSPDQEVRSASNQARDMFSAFDTETALRDDLYLLVAAVKDWGEELEPESQRLLDTMICGFQKRGLGLPPEDRSRLRQLNSSLTQIKRRYLEPCRNNTPTLWFTEDELDGINLDFLRDLERGTGANEGKLRLDLVGMRFHEAMADA